MKANALRKKQRNYYVKLLKKSKKNFFNKFNVNKVTDNKTFRRLDLQKSQSNIKKLAFVKMIK